jgi:Spy/CpxP family protein refolding chaperone
MKKVLALLTIVLIASINILMAQPPGGGRPPMDPTQMLEMMKQRVKPQLIEKTKINEEQADKVLEIQVASQSSMREMRELSKEERTAKMKEIREENNKKFKNIPLTDEQIKAINDFYDEMRKNRMQRGNN